MPGNDKRLPSWVGHAGIGLELAGAVAGFALVGFWIDRHFGSKPWGLVVGLVLGMVNGVLVAFLRVPSIVATLGTLSIFRGIDYLIAGSPNGVPLLANPAFQTEGVGATAEKGPNKKK